MFNRRRPFSTRLASGVSGPTRHKKHRHDDHNLPLAIMKSASSGHIGYSEEPLRSHKRRRVQGNDEKLGH
jgi:hypothetical protein